MKYDKDKDWIRRTLKTADVMNTINGGMASPSISFERKSGYYQLDVRIPGVDADSLGVEVIEDNLILHHKLNFSDENHEGIQLPHVIATFPIQRHVDYKNIAARYETGMLKVTLPFNELSSGFYKQIKIER